MVSPFFKPFQIEELGSVDLFLELTHCLEQYLNLRTLAHCDSFSVWNLQLSLARSAVFLPFVDWRPKPSDSLGFVTSSLPNAFSLYDLWTPKESSY